MLRIDGAVFDNGGFRLSVDLAIPAGALCAVIGPSGGGKSTLLLGIAGFAGHVAGAVTAAGARIDGLPPEKRPVSLLFQEHNLFGHLTVAQNVGLGLRPSLRLSRAEAAKVADALAQVGLEGFGARMPESLSGGQRQRAALARALLRERPALLLDEPFAALGPAQRAEMLALTIRIVRERNMAAAIVTHSLEEAQAADLCAPCFAARITGAKETAALLNAPPPELAEYLGLKLRF